MNAHEKDDLLMEVLYQACGYYDVNMKKMVIDNECTSTYEYACIYLEKKGYLKEINFRIYEVLIKIFYVKQKV